MQYAFPDYYKEFECIKGECRHNCCIGWEIDIDPDTAAFYETVGGELGERMKSSISRGGDPHFILSHNERCPFLNDGNLCDIIIGLGEEHICNICKDHPRFRNELPGRIETGLGLCCEAAAKLILGKKDPVTLKVSGTFECSDEIIDLRDEVILMLQDRSLSVDSRVYCMLSLCGASQPDGDMTRWADILLSLERLDDEWTVMLKALKNESEDADFDGFDAHMADRQTEYEQLLVYLVYRHLANAADEEGLASRAAFAALGYEIIHTLGAVMWSKNKGFTFDEQVELARLFSSEIEYSEDNLYSLLDILTP